MSVLSSGSIVSGLLVKYLNSATFDVERIQKRLLTGERGDDAVRIGMANQFDVEALTGATAISNLNDGISYLNIADSALEAVGSLMGEVQAIMDDALSTSDATLRDALNEEANALISQANDIISSTTFGDQSIFFGETTSLNLKAGQGNSGSFQVAVGSGASLTYGSVDISSAGDPATELADLEAFMQMVEERRGVINAGRSRAEAAVSYLGVMVGVYDEIATSTRAIDEFEEIAALEEATARQEIITGLLTEQLGTRESIVSQIYGSIRQWTA